MDKAKPESLEDLFEEGLTYEVIITTIKDNGKGAPNAAVMGIKRNHGAFELKVFKGSDTFNNLRGLRRLGINVVTLNEIDLMARAALSGWNSKEHEFDPDDYVYHRAFPFLRSASVQIDCKVKDWTETYGTDDYGEFHIASFKAIPERFGVHEERAIPIKRDNVAIIEALVNVTRWKVCSGDTKVFLERRVKDNLRLARSQGGKANMRAVKIIEDFLE